ncbi:hypothetical protein D8Y22_21190 [Salinadaptatus halalkaliphilus]|uniref:Uncharacterized protein n=1 Tax=Salinadaptatus halalkaliphilus TaxID=2419781 RepID=A0A4V3VKT4_9EURY|nr:hypothetical protein [Salinadaptatus halalkaliphilus]THE62967.1 hypothetical protein D8Y22_21190 [Salinadaptatus halalkaliphilus]
MGNESNGGRASAFPDGFAVPITGLLAFLFALLAGMTVSQAVSGSASDLATPVIFALASLLCVWLRQRAIASKDAA